MVASASTLETRRNSSGSADTSIVSSAGEGSEGSKMELALHDGRQIKRSMAWECTKIFLVLT